MTNMYFCYYDLITDETSRRYNALGWKDIGLRDQGVMTVSIFFPIRPPAFMFHLISAETLLQNLIEMTDQL